MEKTRDYLQDPEKIVKVVIVVALAVSVGVGFLVYAGLNNTNAEKWLNAPISELKIWHLLLILFITSILARN